MMSSQRFIKLQKKLRRQVGKAITDYHMIEDGDRIMVCLSGGKDSYTLLDMLLGLQLVAPVDFELIAVNLDQKQPGFPEHVLPNYLEDLKIDYRIVEQDTYSIVKEKIAPGKTTCSLCSRLRRGILYNTAKDLGATKIALGHHMDDVVETMFMNMFHGSRLKTMPPKLVSDDKRNIVIRPLVYCREKDIANYSERKEFPIIPCNLCGSQPNLERARIKSMLTEWDQQSPDRVGNIFRSMQNITSSHLLDTSLFDFNSMATESSSPEHDENIIFSANPH
ncbi:MAG: tRNA 2-thiocytidine(32) synthetase TtcA [Gammaproteobacteria bacterium]